MNIENIKEIAWHKSLWHLAEQAHDKNCFPHALLLSGIGGLGKHQFAYRLANILLCQKTSFSLGPCGECHSCSLYLAGNHPDMFFVTAETSKTSIKVEQVRVLNDKLAQSSLKENKKIIIISPAESMNRAAANALLKILEEPPSACLFLLISNNQYTIPATIKSRCQQWVFRPLSKHEYQNYVGKYEPLSFGAPLRLNDESTLIQQNSVVVCELMAKVAENVLNPVEAVESMGEFELSDLLQLMYLILYDALLFKLCDRQHFFSNVKSVMALAKHKSSLDLYYLLDGVKESMNSTYNAIAINRQLTLENLYIELSNG